jgi:single-strand DNA-binding protein
LSGKLFVNQNYSTMASVNKVILIGNLGADPEIKTFDNGGMVANFRIATTERWKDKNSGELKENTDWHNITVRRPALAKVVQDYIKKGMSVYLEGRLRNRSWEVNGEKKYITEVDIDELTILTPKSQGPTANGAPAQSSSNNSMPPAPPVPSAAPVEDDLPF